MAPKFRDVKAYVSKLEGIIEKNNERRAESKELMTEINGHLSKRKEHLEGLLERYEAVLDTANIGSGRKLDIDEFILPIPPIGEYTCETCLYEAYMGTMTAHYKEAEKAEKNDPERAYYHYSMTLACLVDGHNVILHNEFSDGIEGIYELGRAEEIVAGDVLRCKEKLEKKTEVDSK